MIGQPELPNTRLRAQGFEQGYRESFLGELNVIHVNGRGSYRTALRVALDAFEVNDGIGVVFGVNDHSALAGAEAATRSGRRVSVYAIGGERADFVAGVAEEGPLKAVAAFFPEVVGARGIDLVASALSGAAMHAEATTPHAIITAENLGHYFARTADGWALRTDREAELIGGDRRSLPRLPAGARVGFMPHFPAHDWYRNMIRAMQSRAQDYGIELVIIPPNQGIAAEISRLRRDIAKAAAQRVAPRLTIILGEGEATLYLAEELRRLAFEAKPQVRDITVVTNALDVLRRLEEAPHLKVILTSGEYQAADRCLVGPSLGALFERMRADVAFLSVAGLSLTFGISAQDERLALVGHRFVEAARRTIALADHTLVGADANHRIARIERIDEVITDDGTLPRDRQALRGVGVEVLIAGETAPAARQTRSSSPALLKPDIDQNQREGTP